jgi:NTE family protein
VIASDLTSVLGYLKAIADTAMEAHDRFYVEDENFARTIPIDTLGVKTTEFAIPPEQAQALFDSGAKAAATFLQTWDFNAYKAKYRA